LKDTHVRRCDADYIETARYYTKHNEPTRQVPKSVWAGKLSGGTRKFLVETVSKPILSHSCEVVY
jgi:hypothetical protein